MIHCSNSAEFMLSCSSPEVSQHYTQRELPFLVWRLQRDWFACTRQLHRCLKSCPPFPSVTPGGRWLAPGRRRITSLLHDGFHTQIEGIKSSESAGDYGGTIQMTRPHAKLPPFGSRDLENILAWAWSSRGTSLVLCSTLHPMSGKKKETWIAFEAMHLLLVQHLGPGCD